METFIPLFEIVHWFVAARVESQLEGREWELARAIRFARNRVNHHWAQAALAPRQALPDRPHEPRGREPTHPPASREDVVLSSR